MLTLAEADAELQRLAILRKNHLDEQYVARLRVKELPTTIEHLSERITDLSADRQAMQDQADSGIQITKLWMPREDLLEALDKRLELLPTKAVDSRTVPFGNYKGLEFGVILHPDGNPDAYLKGQATRSLRIHAPKFGPRALINALSRLEETLTPDLERLSRDLTVSQSQTRKSGAMHLIKETCGISEMQLLMFASPLSGKAMGATAGGDRLQSTRQPDLDSEAFAEILHEIQPALGTALQTIQHRIKLLRNRAAFVRS